MPYIAEFGGKYCMWSTVADAPTTYLMDESELIDYLQAELGPVPLDLALHESRMERVRKNGCSGIYGPTKADLLAFNRAGPGESLVETEEEMVRLYTRKEGE
jgi:hypothetical protein